MREQHALGDGTDTRVQRCMHMRVICAHLDLDSAHRYMMYSGENVFGADADVEADADTDSGADEGAR